MAEIGIKDAEGKRGRPAAVLLPVDEAEGLVLASTSEHVQMRREARSAVEAGETVSLDDLD